MAAYSPDGREFCFTATNEQYSKWDKKNQWSDIYWVRIDKIILRLKKEAIKE